MAILVLRAIQGYLVCDVKLRLSRFRVQRLGFRVEDRDFGA